MAVLSVSSIPKTGLTVPAAAASAGGDSFPNSGRVYLIAKNTSGGSLDIVVDTPAVDNFGFSGNALDLTLAVPAGAEKLFGPFNQAQHNDVNGRVQLTYPGGVTGLVVGAFYA